MKLSKKGQSNAIGKQVLGVVLGVVSIVVLMTMAPELWTILDTAFTAIGTADIPFLSGLTGVLGLIFGVVLFLAALYGLFRMVSTRR